MSRNCKATNGRGQPCKATVQKNVDYCFSHDPNKSMERRRAQSRGGKAGSTVKLEFSTTKLESWEQVESLLLKLANDVVQQRVNPKSARKVTDGIRKRILMDKRILAHDPKYREKEEMDLAMEKDKIRRELEAKFGPVAARVAMNPDSRRRVLTALRRIRNYGLFSSREE